MPRGGARELLGANGGKIDLPDLRSAWQVVLRPERTIRTA